MEVAFYNNADYEQFLFSGREKYNFQFNKTNKEFEYFILITEDLPLYTNQFYNKKYLEKLGNLFKKEIKITNSKVKLEPWCMPLNISSEVTSKKTALHYNKERLNVNDLEIIQNTDNLKPNYYYILDGELSGRGHYLYPQDEKKITNLLQQGHSLISEPKRDRFLDISTLFLNEDEFVVYENIIDEKCQYKGTVIKELSEEDWYPDYIRELTKIHEYYKELKINYPFSVDSYFYYENGKSKIKYLSEVNARKTMGWMAYWLHKRFNSSQSIFLISTHELSHNKLVQLNPQGRLFNCYFAFNLNSNDINDIRAEL